MMMLLKHSKNPGTPNAQTHKDTFLMFLPFQGKEEEEEEEEEKEEGAVSLFQPTAVQMKGSADQVHVGWGTGTRCAIRGWRLVWGECGGWG